MTNQIYEHRVKSSIIVCTEEKIRTRFFFSKTQYHIRKLNTCKAYFSRTLKYLNKLLEDGLPGMILSGVGVGIHGGGAV